MDPILIGLRSQDCHEGLKTTSPFGPKEVHYKRTLLIGKAASLAMHLRGLLFIQDYTQLVYATASLGITSLEIEPVLRELEEVDFISINRDGDLIKRIDIRVPEFRSGYIDLGERWKQLKPTDIEQASLNVLNKLFEGPSEQSRTIRSSGLNKTDQAIMLDVLESGLLVAHENVDGQQMIYTPLAVDGNPSAYLQWAKKFPGEVSSAIKTLTDFQGMPISDPEISENEVFNDAIITGVLMPVKVDGVTGDQKFIFAPSRWTFTRGARDYGQSSCRC